MNIKAESLSLYKCYQIADPVIGWVENETVVVLGKYDEVVGVSFVNSPEHPKEVYISKGCLFREVDDA